MTKQETIKIISLICLTFTKTNNEETAKKMLPIWYDFFKNDDYESVNKAVKEHIATKKFMPTVAEIKELMTEKPKLTAFSENDYSDLDRMERLSRGITDEKYNILKETKDFPKEEREKIRKEILGCSEENET